MYRKPMFCIVLAAAIAAAVFCAPFALGASRTKQTADLCAGDRIVSDVRDVDVLVAAQQYGATLENTTLFIDESVAAYASRFSDSIAALGAEVVELYDEASRSIDLTGRMLLICSIFASAAFAVGRIAGARRAEP